MNGSPPCFRSLSRWLCALCLAWLGLPGAQAQEGRWHVLLLASTHDPVAGKANRVSLERAKQQLGQMASLMGLQLRLDEVSGDSLRPEAIGRAVRRLLEVRKASGEKRLLATVMTFTHGANFADTWTRLPFLLCHPTDNRLSDGAELLSVESIYRALREQGQFDHVHVWAELCNNIPYGQEGKAPDIQMFVHQIPRADIALAEGRRLLALLSSCEASIMVSSRYGQISYVLPGEGGIFSASLFRGLSAVAQGKVPPRFDGPGGLFAFVSLDTQQTVRTRAGRLRRQEPEGYVGDVPKQVPQPVSNVWPLPNMGAE
jgi:hypothetical protein